MAWLQAVDYESLGAIEPLLQEGGCEVSRIALFESEALPPVDSFELLIAMGGGFFPTDESHYPWLSDGLELIRATVSSGRRFLGICLGAQLLGRAFGGVIAQNPEQEVGWHAVDLTQAASRHALTHDLPERFTAFHWHQDTVSLPRGARLLASSAACKNQLFSIGDRAVGFQFHPEITEQKARTFLERMPPKNAGPYVQGETAILRGRDHFGAQKGILSCLMKNLLRS